jgi:hypothetical protein
MSFFIFVKNLDNFGGSLYKIAENQSDLNNLRLADNFYKIIEESQNNFDSVKYNTKCAVKYNGNVISFSDIETSFNNKDQLFLYVNDIKNQIKLFLDNNKTHVSFNVWNTYYNQLNSLNLDAITYPLNVSLETYFKDNGQISLNTLQLP